MPSNKVIEVLDRIGIEVPSEEFGHYGVKGMKWGKTKFDTPEDYLEEVTSGGGDGIAGGVENVIDEKDGLLDTVQRSYRTKNGKWTLVSEGHKRGKISKFLNGLFDKKTPYKRIITKNGRTATFKGTRTNQGTIGAFVDKALGRSKKKFPVTTYQMESFKIKGEFKG